MSKRCRGCGVTKPLSAFGRRMSSPDGIETLCSPCKAQRRRHYYETHREAIYAYKKRVYHERAEVRAADLSRSRKWRADNPEKAHASVRRWQLANPRLRAENQSRRHAQTKTDNVEKIDRDYIIQRDRGICHICGHQVARDEESLDHLIPLSKGGCHTHENLRLAHRRCNSQRGTGRLPAQLLVFG